MGDSPLLLGPYNLANIVGVVELLAGVLLTIGTLVFVRMTRKGKIPKA